MDANGDGFLTPDEVRGRPFFERNFIRLDTDRDGRLSLSEFLGIRPFGPPPPEEAGGPAGGGSGAPGGPGGFAGGAPGGSGTPGGNVPGGGPSGGPPGGKPPLPGKR